MRFGLFVPQGWRMDLVGIEPARQWEVMAQGLKVPLAHRQLAPLVCRAALGRYPVR